MAQSTPPGGTHDRRDIDPSSWTRIGMIVPSSNTVLEPVTARMAAPLDGRVSCHFARIQVTEISLASGAQAQFSREPVVAAARQLAEAQCDVIAWNGTSASFLGLDKDAALVAAIEEATGIAATTTSLCFRDAYRRLGVRRLGLVTPYLSEIQERVIANYAAEGIEVVADRRLEDKGNFTFALYSSELVASLIREAAASRPDAVAIVCTNFRGADHVARLETELDLPVLDSVAVTLWGCLVKTGIDPTALARHGRLFALAP